MAHSPAKADCHVPAQIWLGGASYWDLQRWLRARVHDGGSGSGWLQRMAEGEGAKAEKQAKQYVTGQIVKGKEIRNQIAKQKSADDEASPFMDLAPIHWPSHCCAPLCSCLHTREKSVQDTSPVPCNHMPVSTFARVNAAASVSTKPATDDGTADDSVPHPHALGHSHPRAAQQALRAKRPQVNGRRWLGHDTPPRTTQRRRESLGGSKAVRAEGARRP